MVSGIIGFTRKQFDALDDLLGSMLERIGAFETQVAGEIPEYVSDWLDEHPEAMLQDGSVTLPKLASDTSDAINAKIAADSYAPTLASGASEGITGGGPTDTAAWTYRACPGTDGPATIESIHGRTVVWNQMAPAVAAENYSTYQFSDVSFADGVFTGTIDSTSTALFHDVVYTANHKYLMLADVSAPIGVNIALSFVRAGAQASATTVAGTGGYSREAVWYTSTGGPSGGNNRIVLRNYVSESVGATVSAKNIQLFDLTTMFGAGNEPSTVAEFEAMYPDAYYPYDAGSLLSVHLEGIETVGFNQFDEEWELGWIGNDGTNKSGGTYIRSTNYIPVFPNTEYYFKAATDLRLNYYDAAKQLIGQYDAANKGNVGASSTDRIRTTQANCAYIRFWTNGTTYNHDICVNLSDPLRNGEYEPYWKSERTIPAATYFPDGMRSAGTVYDELTSDAAVTRVGVVDLGTLTWSRTGDGGEHVRFTAILTGLANDAGLSCSGLTPVSYSNMYNHVVDNSISGHPTTDQLEAYASAYTDAAAFKSAMSGVILYYALATPTTTIDPPLNLTYKAAAGGTERIMHTDPTAAPTLVVTYGSTADGIRDRALACIAHIENGKASANYGVGSYLIHGGQLCRVTTAIAAGEAIAIGTNVVATTVMAELLTLM